MALPIFTKAGASNSPLTLPKGRFVPVSEPIRPNQIRGLAGGGQTKIADLGDAEEFFPIVMNRISKAKKDDILEFLQHANVNYSENTFTWTDENSVATTVRLWDIEIDIPRVRGDDLYNLRLLLRKEIV